MISSVAVEAMIKAQLPDAQIQVTDLTGGGDHYQLVVISSQFAGKSLIQQHQMVNQAVKIAMDNGSIHALTFKTYTPETWQKNS